MLLRFSKLALTFLGLYAIGVTFLLVYRYMKGYPDYVIPGVRLLCRQFPLLLVPYLKASTITFGIAVVGHLVSVVLAFIVGFVVSFSRIAGKIVKTAAFTLQAFPIVALVPIFLILLSDGFATRILITSIICYFPMLLTISGVMSKEVSEVELFFRPFVENRRGVLFKIRLSEGLGAVITTIIGSASLAVVGAIVAEFVSANSGIGFEIRKAQYSNKLDQVIVALFVIGVLNTLYIFVLQEACGWFYRVTLGQTLEG